MTRWTETDLNRITAARGASAHRGIGANKKSKYRNVPTVTHGIRFDSKLEARYYEQLSLRWVAGDVLWFVRQVNFDLEGGVRYRADFLVRTRDGVDVVDTTGLMTQAKKNKLKQMKARYGIEVQVVRAA